MAEKTLMNSVDDCVDECFRGFSKLHPHLEIYQSEKIVFDVDGYNNKVSVISGGGSGHEPFPSGYVGNGMLTASVSGLIFTSPPASHVLQAIRLAEVGGVLLVVPNYTGDVLNFGLAAEIAISEGIQVETLTVGEDIAQEVYGITSKTGRRGMCGLVLIIKLAGYWSELGYNLTAIKKLSNEALQSMATLGLCVSPCCKPGIGPLFRLEPNEMELGVGVHGEAGVARFKLLTANAAVKLLLGHLIEYLKLSEGDEVVAMVNNLGSLSLIEQWLVVGEVEKQLSKRNINVLRLYAGCLFTSLNMAGIQICLLKLKHNKNMFLEALDYPTSAFAWPGFKPKAAPQNKNTPTKTSLTTKTFLGTFLLPQNQADFIKKCFTQIAQDLIKQKTHLNFLDSVCGDGDCGNTFSCIASKIQTTTLNFSNPAQLFFELSLNVHESIGGTSGALYGLFFQGISNKLEKYKNFDGALVISESWRAGIDVIKKYTTARIGDRTMLDSLDTACEVFEKKINEKRKILDAFRCAVEASELACQKTKSMKAFAGRASYVDQSQQKNVDAGAYAVTVWLSAILHVIDNR